MLSLEEYTTHTRPEEEVVVLDFFGTYCQPCKLIAPILAAMAENEYPDVTFVKINVSEDAGAAELAAKYGVTSVPTLIFMKGGEVKDRTNGAVPKKRIVEGVEKARN